MGLFQSLILRVIYPSMWHWDTLPYAYAAV